MESKVIKGQFTKHIKKCTKSNNPQFKLWYCGITNAPERRENEHIRKYKLISYWKCLTANSLEEANEVEAYFSNKGTTNAPHKGGAKTDSNKVYIFKLKRKQLSELSGLSGINDEECINTLLQIMFR